MRLIMIAAAALFAVGVADADNYKVWSEKQLEIAENSTATDSGGAGRFDVDAWSTVCGQEKRSSEAGEYGSSCFVRYVDGLELEDERHVLAGTIYSGEQGVTVSFGLTGEHQFADRGLRLYRNGFVVWKIDGRACQSENMCVFTGPAAKVLVEAFSDSSAASLKLTFDIEGPTGSRDVREWPMGSFAKEFGHLGSGI